MPHADPAPFSLALSLFLTLTFSFSLYMSTISFVTRSGVDSIEQS